MVRAILLIVASFTVLSDLTQAITIVTGRALMAFGGADGRLPLAHLPQLLKADLRDGASGTLADADLSLRLLSALPTLVHGATIVLATVFLLRVLRGIAQARPFDPFVLTNWRRLSFALLIGGVSQALTDTVANVYLTSRIGLLFGTGAVSTEQQEQFLGGDYQAINTNYPQWPVSVIVAGLVALALTAAFQAGAKLEKDVDGVV
ncbi:hypothetical protein [Cryobacterium aureum]|uniref:hypothetical protein n=1 Tax=Cryobacterium aureum TaxID=995037 RepID=UPI00101ADF8C|nr:hypothetical protein [Cryobacterium aureum]